MDSNAIFVTLARSFEGRTPRRSVGASFDDRVQSSLELADYNEIEIGFVDLCQNLNDFDIEITADEYAQLAAIGRDIGLPESAWNFLSQ